jgi:glycosyltransferase involved in cell wall biosynthesis
MSSPAAAAAPRAAVGDGPSVGAPVRVLVHNDQQYWRDAAGLWTRQPFALFACALAERGVDVVLCGRLEPGVPGGAVRADDRVGFAALPAGSARGAGRLVADAPRALRTWWRALGDADVVWLIGPTAWSVPFAALARVRGVPVVLGVRQDLPRYVAFRHPGDRVAALAAAALDGAFVRLARRRPAIVVGGVLARRYAPSPEVLDVRVSLVRRADVARAPRVPDDAPRVRRALSVGRLDREKHPLLLADVLARAPGWTLDVCGDGPLRAALEARAAELGVADRIALHGQLDAAELRGRYAAADALLHVSWTEGVPQVLLEAFAYGLPVVATDVGGVAGAAGDAALLVLPDDAEAAAAALRRLADDPARGRELAARGLRLAAAHALEPETGRVAALLTRTARLRGPGRTPGSGRRGGRPGSGRRGPA